MTFLFDSLLYITSNCHHISSNIDRVLRNIMYMPVNNINSSVYAHYMYTGSVK